MFLFFCRKVPSIHFFIFGESFVAGQIACDFLLNVNSPTPIYTCITVFVTKDRNTCHSLEGSKDLYKSLKEALFNIATKTTIFVGKNLITCNIAVTKYQ